MSIRVVLLDSGGANIGSLRAALARLGVEAPVSRDPERIRAASHVILPGVGAAGAAMRRLRETGLESLIPQLRMPVLGVCVGMQILFEHSEEGDTPGLGILPGTVRRLDASRCGRVPHMGWNQLARCGHTPLLRDIADADHAYFVHGYAAPVDTHTLAACEYGGAFAAAVARGNFYGVQFHPERSATTGARVLRNFLAL